jgi:hypothetical protein
MALTRVSIGGGVDEGAGVDLVAFGESVGGCVTIIESREGK